MDQAAAISRAAQAGPQASAFREHLVEVIGSPAFKGSRRSQEFLQHIVENALRGHFDELKERALGVGLFGRPASYDTGDDAIVRVTASDVRRRLHHYYADAANADGLQIDLPSGSYIPEFRQVAQEAAAPPRAAIVIAPDTVPPIVRGTRVWVWALGAFAAGALCVLLFLGLSGKRSSLEASAPRLIEPWAALFQPNRPTRIVYCDPDISRIQGLLNFHISLSDYANHQYMPTSLQIAPEMQRALRTMRGVNVAAVDAAIGLSISELGLRDSHAVKTYTARALQLIDFKTEDNFVLLGSPRSNPWFALFDDELDFRFQYDETLKTEIIHNSNVQAGEVARYVPTAQGWDTGQAYSVIAFVANPGQTGHALLLAGSNAEATEAAGKLIVNTDLLAKMLKQNGIDPQGRPQHFEALLKVATMAGTSNTFEVIAFHKLRR
ncbi:MAG: hypothetical protein ABJF23_20590 [Bryobacteraceae bacterium]